MVCMSKLRGSARNSKLIDGKDGLEPMSLSPIRQSGSLKAYICSWKWLMKCQSGPFKIYIAVNGLHSRLTSVGCCAFPLAELEHRSLWVFFAGVLLVTTYSNLPKILKFHTFCPKNR